MAISWTIIVLGVIAAIGLILLLTQAK